MTAWKADAMPRLQRRLICGFVGLAVVLALPSTTVGPAMAGGYTGGHYGHGWGHSRRHFGHFGYRRGHRPGLRLSYRGQFAGLAAVVGGLVILDLLTRPPIAALPRAAVQPAAAPPGRPLRLGNCKPTTGERMVDGRRALMRGTWCSDRHGRGYILNDSVRFVRYLN
jgi:hypothetical protein